MTGKDMVYRDAFLNWVGEATSMMAATGAFNFEMNIRHDVYKKVIEYFYTGPNYGANTHLATGEQMVIRGVPVNCVSPHICMPEGYAVTIQAKGCNIACIGGSPIMMEGTKWPVDPKAEQYDTILKVVKEWCSTKGSNWFQRRDVVRLTGCAASVAGDALQFGYTAGMVDKPGRVWSPDGTRISRKPTPWWLFKFEGTPKAYQAHAAAYQTGVLFTGQGSGTGVLTGSCV
jgi:hypothetical protein